ncbi:alpha/beta fold hydrolase [Saccharomonospora cyanea]|uniref:Putative hydrolase or acyltransferase of alpha/beta superfamily n=1 Tax=Saccharomonospora cyanea NA-134 TaxID=882082 RepID=H5XHK5_9PSEU|nr:alpha/beta hydrolase [Saccharomonospora cyanea]EHR61685.1 putative hydrolase or acyltransferase of alpha/beta superfamily [Saccharomonospora cyanea NA-134]
MTGASARAVLVGAPAYRVALVGEALAPTLREAGLDLDVVCCADLVRDPAACTVAGMAAALRKRLAAGPRPAVLFGDRAGALVVLDLLSVTPDASECAVLSGARTTPSALEELEAAELTGRDRAVNPRTLALLRAASLLRPSRLADDTVLAELLDRLSAWPPETAAERAVLDVAARTKVEPETLAAVTTPCLVLASTLDAVTSPHAARTVARGLPSATLRTIDCGGGPLDSPEATAVEISTFARSIRMVS